MSCVIIPKTMGAKRGRGGKGTRDNKLLIHQTTSDSGMKVSQHMPFVYIYPLSIR